MKQAKINAKEHNRQTDGTVTGAAETGTLTERDRKNIFERELYRGISGPVCDMKKKIGGY